MFVIIKMWERKPSNVSFKRVQTMSFDHFDTQITPEEYNHDVRDTLSDADLTDGFDWSTFSDPKDDLIDVPPNSRIMVFGQWMDRYRKEEGVRMVWNQWG